MSDPNDQAKRNSRTIHKRIFKLKRPELGKKEDKRKRKRPGPKKKLLNKLAPELVRRHLEDKHTEVLSNLTRGLKVGCYELQQAKKSLHRARRIVIKKMLAYTYSDTEICMELGITGGQLGLYKTNLYKEEVIALKKKTPEESFIEYKHNQMEVVKDIDVMIQLSKDGGTVSSLSSALKTKSDILRDIATRAQEMGFMEKKPTEMKLIGGIDLTGISTEDILEMNARQVALIDKLGRGEMTSTKEIDRTLNPSKLKLVVNN